MRRIWLLSCLILAAIPSWAAKRVSIAQLEQLLTADVAAHKQDSEIARQIAGVVLTERISQTTFARLDAKFPAGPLASQAFRVLADQSEFLDLPGDESVSNPAPEGEAQARMLRAAQDYVSQTLRRLPNFLATRTINLYDDTPQAIRQGEWPTRAGFHPVGKSSAEISVTRERDDQPPAQGSAVWQSKIGLLSGGEFGTTLGMILTDAAISGISWSHWERSSGEMLAVFRYSVPASASHFELISSFQREASLEGIKGPTVNGVAGISVRPNVSSSNIEVVRTRPGYHGSIWLNPADGTIYRITMEADMNKGLPFRRAAILVEYGLIDIAGSRFVCPVRSLALSESLATAQSVTGNSATAWLNETLFTDYHRFASSSRILGEAANTSLPDTAPAPQEQGPANAKQAAQPTDSVGPTQQAEDRTPAPDQPQTAPAASMPVLPSAAEPSSTVEPSATDEARTTSVRESETSPVSASSSNAPPAPASIALNTPQSLAVAPNENESTFKIAVNSLLVPVVVLDKRGQSIAGLGGQNFTVEDEGKPRKIIGFTVAKSAPNEDKGNPEVGHNSSTATNAKDIAARTNESAVARTRHIIFLFDDRHLTSSDLALVQKAATHLLEKPLPETDDAAVLSFTGTNSGLTHDRAALQSAVMKLTVHQASQHGKEDCPDVDYYAANKIVNKRDPIEFQIAVQKARQCTFSQVVILPSTDIYDGLSNPTNPFQRAAMAAATHALAMGEEDARESLLSVGSVVRAMSKLPGQRVLILVSSGFLTLSPETMAFKSTIMNIAGASNVIVNTLDARGLYAGNVDAGQGGITSTMDLNSGEFVQDHLAAMQASENVMSELAEGTGGRFFHNSNDLQGGMEALTAAPENLYLLEISLKDVKANGTYHRLQVKVDQSGVEVLARKGYFAPKIAARKK